MAVLGSHAWYWEAKARAFLRRGQQPEVSYFHFQLTSDNHTIDIAKYLVSFRDE